VGRSHLGGSIVLGTLLLATFPAAAETIFVDGSVTASGDGSRHSPKKTIMLDASPNTSITVDFDGNDFRANRMAGIRAFMFAGAPNAGQHSADITVSARNNRFNCNRFYGVIADSFGPTTAGAYRDSRFTGLFEGNEVLGNGRNAYMFSLLQFQQAVLIPAPAVVRPLVTSIFDVSGDLALADVDYWNQEPTSSLVLGGVPLGADKVVHAALPAVCP
jgi:hypothetical protein